MQDERLNLPSASKVSRYAACPGSYSLEQGCDELRTESDIKMAESGARIHAFLSGELSADNLDEKELDVAQKCNDQEDELLRQCGLIVSLSYREQRLWLSRGRKKLLSGKPDAVFVSSNLGFVTDYKTGYGDQDSADENHQIRTNIVLAAEHYPEVETWFGAIIQPLVVHEPQCVKYERTDVAAAKTELLALLERIHDPKARRVAGPQCRWCPAILKCPEAKALLQVFGLIEANPVGETLAGYLVLAKAAKPIIGRLEAQAKKLIKDGPGVPGWTLGKPQQIRCITDAFAAFKLLEPDGLTREQFIDCLDCSVGGLEDALYAIKKPLDKKFTQKLAKALINEKLSEVITLKPKEGSLEQV